MVNRSLLIAIAASGLFTVSNIVDALGIAPRCVQTPTPGVLIRPRAWNVVVPVDKGGSVVASLDDEITSSSSSTPSSRVPAAKHSKRVGCRNTSVAALGRALSALSTISAITAIASSPLPACAAKKAAQQAAAAATTVAAVEQYLHTGQKIANYFRSFGIPDLAVLAILSAMPVVELRGAVPVGVWMGLPITTVLPVCVLGNMIPIVPILFLLRNEKLKKLMQPILARAEKKSASLGVGSIEKQWASLAAFVGIPLPGTGAWTGAMGAFLLGMPTAVALSSIFTGVVAAGVIMTAITLAGKRGGICALAALALITGREFFAASSSNEQQEEKGGEIKGEGSG